MATTSFKENPYATKVAISGGENVGDIAPRTLYNGSEAIIEVMISKLSGPDTLVVDFLVDGLWYGRLVNTNETLRLCASGVRFYLSGVGPNVVQWSLIYQVL